jgi:hypothetical protein
MTSVDILTFYLLVKYSVWAMGELFVIVVSFACGELHGMRYRKD